jgi:hypothetical protein
LYQNKIRLLLCEGRIHALHDPTRQLGQGVAGPHQVQVHIRNNVEWGQRLIEQRSMLGRYHYARLQIRIRSNGLNNGSEFDCLGTGAKDEEDV